jgi:hypothetical protein
MEKKFYEIPEVEVIDVMLEAPIMVISVGDDSDEPQIIDGEGDISDLG